MADSLFTVRRHADDLTEPELIAGVVYEAATDGKDQLRYLAGPEAVATMAQRLAEGSEAYRIRLTKLLHATT